MAKLILICGCGHTGSSILVRIVGAHSLVYLVTQESGMFLANRFFREAEYITKFASAAITESKKYIIEKTPRHIWHVDYIRNKYPDTKFILTTRDGRETIASLYERTKDFKASLKRYQDDSILTLRQLNQFDTLLIRYEDLIDNPSELLKKICNWIGLDFEPDMLLFYKNPIRWNLDNQYSNGKLENHDYLRNRQVNSPLVKSQNSWKNRLPIKFHSELNEFFSQGMIGNKIMNEFGYKICD